VIPLLFGSKKTSLFRLKKYLRNSLYG